MIMVYVDLKMFVIDINRPIFKIYKISLSIRRNYNSSSDITSILFFLKPSFNIVYTGIIIQMFNVLYIYL